VVEKNEDGFSRGESVKKQRMRDVIDPDRDLGAFRRETFKRIANKLPLSSPQRGFRGKVLFSFR